MGQLGGLGVLNLEGLWTRYEDPAAAYEEIGRAARAAGQRPDAAALLRAGPARPHRRADRARSAPRAWPWPARCRPTGSPSWRPIVTRAGVDLFVIRGTTVSAEHVSAEDDALNLKEFIYTLDAPVIVGGVATYRAALHLMRAGAAGVLVGFGGGRLAHDRRRARRAGADGHRGRRRGRRPPGLHGRVRRALRARHRRRRDGPQRRHRQGDRLRRGCRDGRLAPGPGRRGARARAGTGGWRPCTPSCPAASGTGRARWAPWSRSCTARAASPTAP